jgi:hypothetical protein
MLIRSRHWAMGNRDGEEDYENPTVDEGRCPRVEDARARKDKDNGDRAEAEAERSSDLPKGIGTPRDAGDGSEETTGVKGNCPVHGHLWDSSPGVRGDGRSKLRV